MKHCICKACVVRSEASRCLISVLDSVDVLHDYQESGKKWVLWNLTGIITRYGHFVSTGFCTVLLVSVYCTDFHIQPLNELYTTIHLFPDSYISYSITCCAHNIIWIQHIDLNCVKCENFMYLLWFGPEDCCRLTLQSAALLILFRSELEA
jgi:hypothetical protein